MPTFTVDHRRLMSQNGQIYSAYCRGRLGEPPAANPTLEEIAAHALGAGSVGSTLPGLNDVVAAVGRLLAPPARHQPLFLTRADGTIWATARVHGELPTDANLREMRCSRSPVDRAAAALHELAEELYGKKPAATASAPVVAPAAPEPAPKPAEPAGISTVLDRAPVNPHFMLDVEQVRAAVTARLAELDAESKPARPALSPRVLELLAEIGVVPDQFHRKGRSTLSANVRSHVARRVICRRLRDEGQTITQIVTATGLHHNTVGKHLQAKAGA